MEVRSGESPDRAVVEDIALSSLRASYSHFIDEETIETAVAEWYDDERFGRAIEDENEVLVVAEEDDEVVGFAQGALVEATPVTAELYWVHVDPDARQSGIGVRLLGGFQEKVDDLGAERLRGLVLTGNEDGAQFYEDHNFERVDERTIAIGDQQFDELVYEKHLGDEPAEQVLETVEGPEGRELTVNFSDGDRGGKGVFYTTYTDPDLTEKYGFYCGNCESLNNAMDTMGRIVCGDCGNQRKATRWDASYL